MGWLGLDDTDHIGGGCTTHTLFELIQQLPKKYVVSSQRLVDYTLLLNKELEVMLLLLLE